MFTNRHTRTEGDRHADKHTDGNRQTDDPDRQPTQANQTDCPDRDGQTQTDKQVDRQTDNTDRQHRHTTQTIQTHRQTTQTHRQTTQADNTDIQTDSQAGNRQTDKDRRTKTERQRQADLYSTIFASLGQPSSARWGKRDKKGKIKRIYQTAVAVHNARRNWWAPD